MGKNTDKLAQKLINDHKNPLVKLELPGLKYFLRPKLDENLIEKGQSSLKNALEHTRVERRCARAQGIWMEKIQRAKITKVVKHLVRNFGYQDKTGIFLYPEEMLFLLETNRLEMLKSNDNPLSIEEGFNLLLNQNITLTEYKVYKRLALQGYKLVRNQQWIKKVDKIQAEVEENTPTLEEVSDEVEESDSKKQKIDCEDENKFTEIFKKLQQNGPKPLGLKAIALSEPDYRVFLPTTQYKNKPDFNLFIRETCDLSLEEFPTDIPNIFAMCRKENVTFLKFNNIALPNLFE